jgi:hypothetical protein
MKPGVPYKTSEKKRVASRAYYKGHKVEMLLYQKRYRREHKDKIAAWREENREYCNERARAKRGCKDVD